MGNWHHQTTRNSPIAALFLLINDIDRFVALLSFGYRFTTRLPYVTKPTAFLTVTINIISDLLPAIVISPCLAFISPAKKQGVLVTLHLHNKFWREGSQLSLQWLGISWGLPTSHSMLELDT